MENIDWSNFQNYMRQADPTTVSDISAKIAAVLEKSTSPLPSIAAILNSKGMSDGNY